MNGWLIFTVCCMVLAAACFGYLGWLKLSEWLAARREARLQTELDATLLELRRTEDALRTELRLGSLEARRRLIRASFEYAQQAEEHGDAPRPGPAGTAVHSTD